MRRSHVFYGIAALALGAVAAAGAGCVEAAVPDYSKILSGTVMPATYVTGGTPARNPRALPSIHCFSQPLPALNGARQAMAESGRRG